MATEWNITDASFAGITFHVAVPKAGSGFGVMSQDISNERRLQISEKPLVDGAEVEDFGRKARMLNAEVIFFGNNYASQLKAFEDALNSGKSGVLILPDLSEAVYAKYQKHTRKSSHQDGQSTTLAVSWIEDRTGKKQVNNSLYMRAAAKSIKANNLSDAAITAGDSARQVGANIAAAQKALSANTYLNLIAKAEGQIVNATQTINGVLNIPRKLRQDLITSQQRIAGELGALQAAVKGIQNFTDLLSLAFLVPSPTRFSSGVAVDFTLVDQPITSIVSGVSMVVSAPVAPVPAVQSFPDAVKLLAGSSAKISAGKAELETKTSGQTADYSSSATTLVNSILDLVATINTPATTQVMTDVQTTLLEVCFANGLDVSAIDSTYRLNTHLTDILNIPPFTVVTL